MRTRGRGWRSSIRYRTEASVLAVLHMSLTSRGGTSRAAALLLEDVKHHCHEGGKADGDGYCLGYGLVLFSSCVRAWFCLLFVV